MQNKPKALQSTQEYINLADIKSGILYMKDGKTAQFIKISPISTALMSPKEKEQMTMKMTREISPTKTGFKVIFLTRPTDVRLLVDYYEGIKSATQNTLKRESISKTIKYFSQLATNGSVLERQTFLSLSVTGCGDNSRNELKAKTIEMRNALLDCGISCSICDDTQIVNMLGLFHSPSFNTSVPVDTTPKMTFLSEGGRL